MANLPESLAGLEGEYACCVVDKQTFGVKTSVITDIVEAPPIRKVPRTPAHVEGVANIKGRITTVLSPRSRFNLQTLEEQAPHRGREKVVVIQLNNTPYGLLVDSVTAIARLSQADIEPLSPVMVGTNALYLSAMGAHHSDLVYLLDLDAFIYAGIASTEQVKRDYDAYCAQLSSVLRQSHAEKKSRFLELVIGKERYGIDALALREVIPAQGIEPIAGSPAYVVGKIASGDRHLPVIDLQKKFGLEKMPYDETSRVVVLELGEFSYGIIANSVRRVFELADREIKDASAIISGRDAWHIKGVGRLGESEMLVVILDPSGVLKNNELKQLETLEGIGMNAAGPGHREARDRDVAPYLIFSVAGTEFAVETRLVSEVVPYKEPVRVPKAPSFVKGIATVRGRLVSIIDLMKRLDPKAKETACLGGKIIIFQGQKPIGIVADAVSDILKVSERDIVPPADLLQGMDSRSARGILPIPDSDRSAMVLNVKDLFPDLG
jgi:purine-binding chemotaxis protein CheW